MNTQSTPTFIQLGVLTSVIVALGIGLKIRSQQLAHPPTTATCIPTFVDGGGPYYQANTPFRDNIAPDESNGEKLIVSGRVLMSDCVTPLANAVVDIWQANESGNYEDEWYRGRVTTDAHGNYSFTTVIPLGYGEGTAYRPPHIHFKIWQNDKLLITSQMFLPPSRNQGIEEAYIMEVTEKKVSFEKTHLGRHDIILP